MPPLVPGGAHLFSSVVLRGWKFSHVFIDWDPGEVERGAAGKRIVVICARRPIFNVLLVPCVTRQLRSNALRLVRRTFRTSPRTVRRVGRTRERTVSVTSRCARGCLVKTCSRRGAMSHFLRGLSRSPRGMGGGVQPFVRNGLLRVLALVQRGKLSFCRGRPKDGILCTRRTCRMRPRSTRIHFAFRISDAAFHCRLRYCCRGRPFSLSSRGPIVTLATSPTALLLKVGLCFFPRVSDIQLLPFAGGGTVDTDTTRLRGCVSGVIVPVTHCRRVVARK